MIVTAHQPAYLPWLGYIHKIAISDIYVLLDDVQFEKNSFTNRNKIWSANGEVLLTVPIQSKGHIDKPMRELEISNNEKWCAKHWKSIELNYKKAPYSSRYAPWLESIYNKQWNTLVELTDVMLSFFLGEMGITTKIVRQSELSLKSHKQDLVFDLCKATGATTYISGKLGKDYIDAAPFEGAGIKVYFQDYNHPVYPQIGNREFTPYLGIIDLLMNVGPDQALQYVLLNNDSKSTLTVLPGEIR